MVDPSPGSGHETFGVVSMLRLEFDFLAPDAGRRKVRGDTDPEFAEVQPPGQILHAVEESTVPILTESAKGASELAKGPIRPLLCVCVGLRLF